MRSLAVSIFAATLAVSATAAGAAQLRGADLVFAPGAGTYAPGGKSGPATSVPVTPTGGVLAPLTAQECKSLGGSVITASVCNSGSSCQRTDQNGTVHEVCLSQ